MNSGPKLEAGPRDLSAQASCWTCESVGDRQAPTSSGHSLVCACGSQPGAAEQRLGNEMLVVLSTFESPGGHPAANRIRLRSIHRAPA